MRLAAFFILTSALACSAADNAAGRWEGSIKIPGQELAAIIDLEQPQGKDWIGSIIIPGLDVKGAPLTDIAVADAGISFTIKGALASERTGQSKFQAHLSGADQLSGDFLAAGNTAPFSLKKTGPPQVELPRQSTEVSRELEGEWKGDFELNGYPRHVTLTLKQDGKAAGAEFLVFGKQRNDLPVDLVTYAEQVLRVEASARGAAFEGRYADGALTGNFELGAFEFPLVLKPGVGSQELAK